MGFVVVVAISHIPVVVMSALSLALQCCCKLQRVNECSETDVQPPCSVPTEWCDLAWQRIQYTRNLV